MVRHRQSQAWSGDGPSEHTQWKRPVQLDAGDHTTTDGSAVARVHSVVQCVAYVCGVSGMADAEKQDKKRRPGGNRKLFALPSWTTSYYCNGACKIHGPAS
jgi:hypothetical protein